MDIINGSQKTKYVFSGHESFQCKSLWLKKGYDFVFSNKDFSVPSAVVDLGVGKNMVSAIRFWLRAFGLTENDELQRISHYIFNQEKGKDPYIEDLGTLWLLHYLLVSSGIASVYQLTFIEFHKERNEFDKDQLQGFIKRKCSDSSYSNIYNENTVRKDIGVLLQNYVAPSTQKSNEDFSVLLLELNLITQLDNKDLDRKTYTFNTIGKRRITQEILLYAIIDKKGNDMTVSFESLLELSLLFCLSTTELIETIKELVNSYPNILVYKDDGGIRQLHFLGELDKFEVLENHFK
jgi:hypothetical protein